MDESDSISQDMISADPNIGIYCEHSQHKPIDGIKFLVQNLIRDSEFTTPTVTQRRVSFSAIEYLADRIKPRISCRIDGDVSRKINPSPKSKSNGMSHLDDESTFDSTPIPVQSQPVNHSDEGDFEVESMQYDDTTTESLKKDDANDLDSSYEESGYSSSSFVSEESDD